jgi:tyrosinase
LFEQALYEQVQDIAANLPAKHKDRYVKAAKIFRLPYWDPFALSARTRSATGFIPSWLASTAIPLKNTALLQDSDVVKALLQDGRNPVYDYTFPFDADSVGGFAPDAQTSRSPNANNNIWNAIESSGRTDLWNAVNDLKDFNQYTNDAWASSDANTNGYASLEQTHNLVHGNIGGYMGSVAIAAFDPIFWLHHANIDRLLAIWQARYPDNFMTTTKRPNGSKSANFMLASDAKVNNQTPLWPFRHTSSQYWTSEGVEKTTSFGYAYPETQRWNFATDAALSKDVVTKFNTLYQTIVDKARQVRARVVAVAPEASIATTAAPAPVKQNGFGAPSGNPVPVPQGGFAAASQAGFTAADEQVLANPEPEALMEEASALPEQPAPGEFSACEP